MPAVSDYIKLSADESIIKEYRGFEMKKPQKAALHIAVTSKRLIFYGMSKAASKMNRPSLTQEMKIDDIRGLEIYEKRTQSLLLALLGGLIFLTGLFGLYSPTTSFFFNLNERLGNQIYGGSIVAIIGLIIFLISFAAGTKVTALVLRGKNENLNLGIFQEKTLIKWGTESQKMLCELGSVLLDIQDGVKGKSMHPPANDYSSYDDSPYDNNADYADYKNKDYDEVFETKEDFEEDISLDTKTDEDYPKSPDIRDYPVEDEELGKELGTGGKRDDYLF